MVAKLRPTRVSGQRRYPPSAVQPVGVILFLRDVGFTLRELKALIASRSLAGDGWRELHERKFTELGPTDCSGPGGAHRYRPRLGLPAGDIQECPNFASVSRRA
jgi:hypothetical protein